MKTKQEVINAGFQIVAKDSTGMEIWARFTGYLDCVQYIYCYDDKCLEGVLEVKSLGELHLHKIIFEGLMYGKGAGKRDIYPEHIWHEEWKNDMNNR